MSTSTITHLPKSTVQLEINIPWQEIQSSYEEILKNVTQEAEIEGFRKGKAPKSLVEEKTDKNKLYEEVIKKIVPQVYAQAISEHKLNPIISPKIEIIKAKENQDWTVKATIVLKPKINLKNYKEKIKKLRQTKVKLWTPGQDKTKKDDKLSVDEIINALLEEADVELSDELIKNEANRLLADLVDQTRQVGLTIEQYLISKGKTNDQLKAEYAKTAQRNLSLEFILMEIADQEKITVDKEDINNLINKVENSQEREKLIKDSYYLAHLIRQQKTIDLLNNL
ncbi:hypothetical protein A3I51_00945 [Candidatus Gottesmanbacteria bacterium RIFCSPLOWO2_02_FULL_38_8]|uniref:Trigger factor n=1 Tax=Candidatus Gottesmanbacteria bacterium RIFCSPLOWO2_02_FULL_38_8 TaxID=1798397 RepID=A0A1F6B5Q4_9BACT|nr:MAG: hypothetical protein A3I51_00945 [Candidatus Gottesmanbacteria bacterium RIFCSPLOWO2_02_FULL_38_8]